jgi:hypothetical protein
VRDVFLAALLYADDMAVLAPSLKGLQLLLDTCYDYCVEWDICLNSKKSKAMYFGKRRQNLSLVTINSVPLEWVNEWVYLGVDLLSGKVFGCSITERVKKLYRCANGLFRINGKSNDLTMLRLVESHCVPVLTYAVEVVHVVDSSARSKLRVAYNSLFRRIEISKVSVSFRLY